MLSIASKFYGEGEQVMKAVFTLANKLAPSVIFTDEVHSVLCSRDDKGEHEASRKTKTKFYGTLGWTSNQESERVLVLAATNRPYDLDEANIRSLPRRLMVDLPSRGKLLRVILAKEKMIMWTWMRLLG
jgi:SpoVK/Ycf46/Vps4 family AAA+-type ATPase